jgi:hypothetical protein
MLPVYQKITQESGKYLILFGTPRNRFFPQFTPERTNGPPFSPRKAGR